MAGLHFDATLENSGFIQKLEEIKKGIKETSRLIEEEGKRIDSINQRFESFDEEVLKMCGNLNKYFDDLLSKVESMASMLQVGKVELSAPAIKSDGTSTQQLEELRSCNAELTAELEKQRAEIKHQQEEWNKLATAIKSNNVSAVEQYKQATASSTNAVKDAKLELKGLSKELDDNLKYYDKLAVQAAAYKEELIKLQDAQAKGIARVVTGANGTSMPVNDEIDRLKNSLSEVRENQKGVSQEITAQRQRQVELNTVIEQGNEKHVRTRTLIMDAREQMIQMRTAGLQNTIQYQQAGEELGKMRLQMKLVNAEMEFLANPNKGIATLKAGLSGAATSASLLVGIMGLFNDKSEKMAELQTKIQSLMAVVVGLEGTYGMLKKSNTMMLAIENVRRKAIITSMALETKAKTTNIALTWSEVAAQKALNIVAKANPYVLLATAILTVVGGVWLLVEANRDARKEIAEFNKSVAESAATPIAKVEELSMKWNRLGNNLDAKKKFVDDNKKAFNELGLAILDVVDAENLLNSNKDSFISAMIEKAKAAQYIKQQEKNIAKLILAEQNIESKKNAKYEDSYYSNGESISAESKRKAAVASAEKQYDEIAKKIKEGYTLAANAEEEGGKKLKNARIKSADDAENLVDDYTYKMMTGMDRGKGNFESFTASISNGYKSLLDTMKNETMTFSEKIGNFFGSLFSLEGNDNSVSTIGERVTQLRTDYFNAQNKLKGLRKPSSKANQKEIDIAQKEADKIANIYKNLTGKSIDDKSAQNKAEKLREQQEKYATLMNKQALEQKRSAEDLQTQTDQARINAMREGNARTLAQMKFNHQKEMRQLERQQEDVLRKKLENTKSAFEANPSNKGKSFSKVYEEAVNTQKTGDEMVSLFGGGNVDLLARPMIDAAKLVEKGWKDAGDGIATVFSSAYEVEQDGKNVSIQVTPILPDGTVMSQNELESYIDIQLNGAKDVLEADNKGIVIHVDTDVSPEKAEAFGQKLHEYQEKYYDGVSGLSKKGLNLGDFSLSKSQKDSYSQQKGYLNIQHKNETKKYYDNILKEYQDYTDKRLAIETKFNKDIKLLDEQREIAAKNGDTQQVEQIDRAKAQATKNKGMELMNLDYDKLKESPEYVRAFENLKETSSETLNSLLNQLENAKSAAAKVLSPDQLREYTSTIQSIMDELDSRNPFQSLSDKKKELAEAEEELANAQMELENARQTAEAVKGGAKIENGVKSSKFNEKTGKIESTKAYLSEAQALDKVKKKTENYNAAKDKVVKKDNQVKKSEKEVRAQISELADTIDELGKSIGGPAGEIISLIGSIGSFTMTAMAGVEAAADTSANAISTVEKASVILAIIGAAVQIAMKIFDMFGKDDTTEKYEKAKEAYESYINILDRVIEKQLELAETLTGDTANAVYEAAIANIKKQSENAKVLGKQYLNSGASGKSHSKGYDEVDDMSGEGWKQAAETLGMSEKEFKKKMGGRMTGLFDLTDEQLLKLQSDAGIFWSQLDSDTQKYADQIANGVGKVAEVLEQQIADTTLIDYDSLRSDFQDLLSDMDADSADFADNFEDYMRNAILNSMLKDEFMDRLTAWREKLYNAMDDGVTEDEYNVLKAEGQQIADEMKDKRDAMSDIYKWDKDDDEREASKKGIATASQDSVDENNGRLAVMQEHTYSINENVNRMATGIDTIVSHTVNLSCLASIDKTMQSLLTMRNEAVGHLSNIDNYTSNLVEMKQYMNSMKQDINTMLIKGLKLSK